jgi:MFS family permease
VLLKMADAPPEATPGRSPAVSGAEAAIARGDAGARAPHAGLASSAAGLAGLSAGLRLSAYWFSQNFLWGAMLAVVLPTEVLRFVPAQTAALDAGAVAAAGAAVAVLTYPLAGAWSDRARGRWGRRRPFIALGSVAAALGLAGMDRAASLPALVAAFLLLQLGSNAATAPYQAYIPDLVPSARRGSASGYMGLMSMLGSLAGLAAAGVLVRPGHLAAVYPALAAVVLAGAAVTVWALPEAKPADAAAGAGPRTPRPFWVDPRRHPDFWWVLATRGLVMMAFYSLLAFLEYFLKEAAGLPNYVGATALLSAVAVVVGALSSVAAGRLSDRTGRRPVVSAAGALMGVVALAFTAMRSWAGLMALAALFGVGYGAYTSVDWALACDVLPGGGASAAKDMGFAGLAATVPQVLAPALGGPLITLMDTHGGSAALGYRVLYAVTGLYALAGSALVWRVRGVR